MVEYRGTGIASRGLSLEFSRPIADEERPMPAETQKFPESPAEGDRKVIERELRRQEEKDDSKKRPDRGAPGMNEDPHPLDRRE
jgi:hypothetical protein